MKEIYQKWEEDWLSAETDKEKAKKEAFFLLFEYDYKYSCRMAKENERKNFGLKFLCVLPFLIVTVLYLAGVIAYNWNVWIQVHRDLGKFFQDNNWNFSIYGTVFYVVAVLLTHIASKWIDVKQYQKTWCRHSEHKYAVEMELFKYIYRMDDYHHSDRKQKFIRNIMKIWDENQKRFIENMKNEKDMGMGELLKHIKGEEVKGKIS